MKKIKLAIIGYGYWGPNYARIISELPGVQLAFIVDKLQKNLEGARKFGAQIDLDYKAVLQKDIDAVVITTPTSTHFEIAKAALLAGKHVLCEKPLAMTTAQAKFLERLSQKQRKVLMTGYTFIYNSAFEALLSTISKGRLGKIYFLSFVRTSLGPIRDDVNALWDLAPHDVSMIMRIMPDLPKEVFSLGRACLKRNNEDVVFSMLKFADGTVAQISSSWLSPIKTRTVTIVGSKKMAVFDDVALSGKITLFDKGVLPARGSTFTDFSKAAIRSGGVTHPKYIQGEPLVREFGEFIKCITKQKSPATNAQFMLKVTRVLEACQKSLENNSVIKL